MKSLYTVVAGMCCALALHAADNNGVVALSEALAQQQAYSACIDVTLTLPMAANDEVQYSVTAVSEPTPNDSLLGVAYLIDWTLPTPSGNSTGFTAYFNGNFYRFREGGGRIQELHADREPFSFTSETPVQTSAQFFESLPVALANEILQMASDSTFSVTFTADTLYRGIPASVLMARHKIQDIDVANILMVFDRDNCRPIMIEKEMSPGTISEQTVVYRYSYGHGCSDNEAALDEARLVDMYPEAFALYREGNYGINSLKGKSLPGFSLPTLNGDRVAYNRGDQLPTQQLLVFLDEQVATTPQVIQQVREALQQTSENVEVMWIFLSNRQDDIAPLFTAGRVPRGEIALTSGRNVVQDFGVTETPTFILADTNATVQGILVGFNQNLVESVITLIGE